MTNTKNSMDNIEIEGTGPIWNIRQHGPSLTFEMRAFYAAQATDMKNKIDGLHAEISQRQDKMRLINDIIAEINNLTDEKNGLDISQNAELLEKLQVAKDLGVKVKLSDDPKKNQTKFNAIERDRLIENLHLASDSWDKENRHQMQKMEIHVKDLDRIMMLLKDVDKKEDQAKRPMLAGIRGAGG